MIITICLIIKLIEQSVDLKIYLGLSTVITALIIIKSINDHERYKRIFDTQSYNYDRAKSANLVRKYADKDEYVFNNIPPTPAYTYMAKHLTFPVKKLEDAKNVLDLFKSTEAQYYHHEGSQPVYMIPFTKVNDSLHLQDTVWF